MVYTSLMVESGERNMIVIEFFRYVPTLKTYVSFGHVKNVFKKTLDHEDKIEASLEKAKCIAERWLQDHYGHVNIYIKYRDVGASGAIVALHNMDKMEDFFNNLGLEIIIDK